MFCIYCGAQNNDLTDEHIIPAGLGGDQILQNVSCADCQNKTSLFERRVLRDGYGLREIRSVMNIGKRRRKEKPTKATIYLETTSEKIERTLPLAVHPLPFSLPLFDAPSALSDGVLRRGICLLGYHAYTLGPKPNDLRIYLGEKEATIGFRVRGYDYAFSNLLAKIAWCSWVAEFGTKHLDESWLPSVITGEEKAVGKYVGTFDYALTGLMEPLCLHSVLLTVLKHQKGLIATARIQLFLQLTPCPTYIVHIGRVHDGTHVPESLANWYLPRQGMIGRPLTDAIPRWVGTVLIAKHGAGEKRDEICAELRAIGLTI